MDLLLHPEHKLRKHAVSSQVCFTLKLSADTLQSFFAPEVRSVDISEVEFKQIYSLVSLQLNVIYKRTSGTQDQYS